MTQEQIPKIRPGWNDDGLEEAAEIIATLPPLNAVLDRESALLSQNIISGLMSRTEESALADVINAACKKVLARSMLVGLRGATPEFVAAMREQCISQVELVTRLRAALRPFADYADKKGHAPATLPISPGSVMTKRQLTMGDCYAAARALEQGVDKP